jgi:hypothetical protein
MSSHLFYILYVSVADSDPGSGAFLIPGSGMGKKSGSGSGMNNPDHISESLETMFGLKYFNSFVRIRDPGWKKFGSGIRVEKFGSGINIPDPQHCCMSSHLFYIT